MIGLTGLLNLLDVVSRRQPAQQDCPCAPQEAGVPCLASPPDQTILPALPPAFDGAHAQPLGPVTATQSATVAAPGSATSGGPRKALGPAPVLPTRSNEKWICLACPSSMGSLCRFWSIPFWLATLAWMLMTYSLSVYSLSVYSLSVYSGLYSEVYSSGLASSARRPETTASPGSQRRLPHR
jgi:hypothetical protein